MASRLEKRNAHGRCMNLMSALHKEHKKDGCVWNGSPMGFIKKNWKILELVSTAPKCRDYFECERILKTGVRDTDIFKPTPSKQRDYGESIFQRKDAHGRCLGLMSQLYKDHKVDGCLWHNNPMNFIRKNWKLLGLASSAPKIVDHDRCEWILKSGSTKPITHGPEFPKPEWSEKSHPDYQALKAYLSSQDGVTKWQQVRFEALRCSGGRCCLCGATAKSGVTLHVDHIKPKSRYPLLAFELSNLQVLCADCNLGKGNRSEDDFRSNV